MELGKYMINTSSKFSNYNYFSMGLNDDRV